MYNILKNLSKETPGKMKIKLQKVFANLNTAYCENKNARVFEN